MQNFMQNLVDGLGSQWQRERAETQMTLGKMIAALQALPAGTEVENLKHAHSYRGYYCDLAFERGEGKRGVSDLLKECHAAMGAVFQGYKGGDFVMGDRTPVWVAEYGNSGGEKILGLLDTGMFETKPYEED